MSCHILFDHFRAVSRMLRHVVSTIVDQKNRDLNSPRGSPCQNGKHDQKSHRKMSAHVAECFIYVVGQVKEAFSKPKL